MESALRISSLRGPKISHSCLQRNGKLLPRSVFGSGSGAAIRVQGVTCDNGGLQKRRSSVESPLFRYDTPIPEEIIEKPVGLLLPEKNVEKDFRCPSCQAKGAVLCATCSGSGLYIDSIMESQGIIVKVRCLGCGGTGNIMCSECGGRGHI